MKKRIIAVNSNCYHGFSIEEAIAGIRDAGFHYIELTATKGWTEHVFPDRARSRAREKLRQRFYPPPELMTEICFFVCRPFPASGRRVPAGARAPSRISRWS